MPKGAFSLSLETPLILIRQLLETGRLLRIGIVLYSTHISRLNTPHCSIALYHLDVWLFPPDDCGESSWVTSTLDCSGSDTDASTSAAIAFKRLALGKQKLGAS